MAKGGKATGGVKPPAFVIGAVVGAVFGAIGAKFRVFAAPVAIACV